jgi:hypothetical protein
MEVGEDPGQDRRRGMKWEFVEALVFVEWL